MRIAPNCFAVTGLACTPPWTVNAGFVVGQTRTLVVDTGQNFLAAQTIYGYATSVRPTNTLSVVNTERHLDHISGNGYFRDKGCEIYGHPTIVRSEADFQAQIEEYKPSITNGVRRERGEASIFFSETYLANPGIPLWNETALDLGELEIEILFTPGHTPSNISVFVPSVKVLYCGDCLVSEYLPNLENGGPADWQIWLDSLDKIETLAPQIIVPGHGHILSEQRLAAEIERHRQVLKAAIAEGIAPTLK